MLSWQFSVKPCSANFICCPGEKNWRGRSKLVFECFSILMSCFLDICEALSQAPQSILELSVLLGSRQGVKKEIMKACYYHSK